METTMQKDSYIEENRWFITASKLKSFIISPEYFFLKYIKEVPPLKEGEKDSLKMGTALDDLISYGEEEFYKKYYVDTGMKVAELRAKCDELGIEHKGLLKDDIVDILSGWKKKLTNAIAERIFGMYNELKRQDLFETGGDYETQKTFISTYGNLQLKGTLDQYKLGTIRDTKSCSDLSKFIYDWRNYGYDVSMSFYWVLVQTATWEDADAILDVAQSTFPYPSNMWKIPKEEILMTVQNVIKPALDQLDALMNKWEETKDESIWEITNDRIKARTLDLYPIMKSVIQEEFEYLQ